MASKNATLKNDSGDTIYPVTYEQNVFDDNNVALNTKISNINSQISAKQPLITGSNKLSADLTQDGSTNKVFTATEKTKLSELANTPIATTSVAGKVKPDGTTITIDNDGTIHSQGGSSIELYSTTGQNTDGAMTQKATTDELNKKLEVNEVGSPTSPVALATPSNPNLLINGDFRINQRGFTTNNSTSSYTVDRWYKRAGGATRVDYANGEIVGTVQTTGTGTLNLLEQTLEDGSSLIGKKVTASVIVKSLVGTSWILSVSARTVSSQISFEQITLTQGFNHVTYTVPADTVYVRFTVLFNRDTANIGDTITFTDCKLEVGNIATPFSPRPYGEELALCQRYYWKLTPNFSYSDICLMTFISENTGFIGILTLPQEMRIAPTFTVSGTPTLTFRNTTLSVTSLTREQYQGNQAILKAVVSDATGLDLGTTRSLRSSGNKPLLEFDAEIY